MFLVMDGGLLQKNSQYERLPECLKSVYSEREYAWLSNEDKRTLIQRETEPECE
jgi:hypothetical protein